jgi:hypothetical protein
MAGGLMQLVAYGAQDMYLTGAPKVTFFQAVYKKHTNFAMETIDQTLNGAINKDARVSTVVARNGDLVGEMFLQLYVKPEVTANLTTSDGSDPDAVWCAERAIKTVELVIGGQSIDKHHQKWWRLYSELYLDDAKKVNYGKMTSASAPGPDGRGMVYLPLIFFFNRNPGLYLPLIAMQYHEVRLDFELSSEFEDYFDKTQVRVCANYVFLDTEERRRFAQKGHEYLIEQVQHTGVSEVDESTTFTRLSYNHPVKELVWCFTDGIVAGKGNGLWNFCPNDTANVTVTLDMTAEGSNALVLPHHCSAPHVVVNGSNPRLPWVEEADPTSTSVVAGPLKNFRLVLNGQDRFKEQPGKYFNQVQPHYHHSGNPYPGVYSYSFALKPEEHQPTGTCNFSRIDNAQVFTELKSGAGVGTPARKAQLHMFAVNYNVLRVQSGMSGLAFSN